MSDVELDCGIAKARIDSWLDDELALACEGDRRVFSFKGERCVVSTRELERRSYGPIKLDRTGLAVEGQDGAVEEFMRLFTLRFMSVGG